MIYYFSGNGNSRWVAEQIAAATNDTVENISDYIKNKKEIQCSSQDEKVGIVFPIHSWYAPQPVIDFVDKLRFNADTYRYMVCTCGDDAGKTASRFRRHFKFDAAWSVRMPNTYIPMFDLDSDTVARIKIEEAGEKIKEIAEDVNNRKKKVRDVFEGAFPFTKTYIINYLFYKFVVTSKGFTVDDSCISCGNCRDACPVNNIRLVDGRPTWADNCIHCMACIHTCPQRSINFKTATKKRGRYLLKRYVTR